MALWANMTSRSQGKEHRKEDNNNIENNIPAELYKIEEGQIVVFTSKDGVDQATTQKMNDLFVYLRNLDIDIKLNVVATDNEDYLIDNVACRSHKEIGNPYKVAVGSWDTVAGLIAHYADKSIEEVVNNLSPLTEKRILSISANDIPVVIPIDADKRPIEEQNSDSIQSSSVYREDSDVVELLVARPEKGSKKEKNFIKAQEDKIIKVLRDCSLFDITLELADLDKRFKESLMCKIDHKILLDIRTKKAGSLSFCTTCDIYVGEGKEYLLPLTAIEKAVYLAFLSYENGIRILETSGEFRNMVRKIYIGLPAEEKCETTAGSILDTSPVDPKVYERTLRSNMSEIASKINNVITNPKTALEFAIEGYKGQEFGVARTTPELKAQIKKAFDL